MQAILETPVPQRTIPQTFTNVLCLPGGCAVSGPSIGHRYECPSEPELAECGERYSVNTGVTISFFPSEASLRALFGRAELESAVLFRQGIVAGD